MALDAYLVFPQIAGEPTIGDTAETNPSIASSFPNAGVIQITSFDLAVANTTTIASGPVGGGAGKTLFQPLVIGRAVDKASPVLFSLEASGHVFATVQMYVQQAGATPVTMVGYEFHTVVITRIEWVCAGSDVVSETITLEYGSMVVVYQPRNADGTPGQVVQGGWNQTTNTQDLSSSLVMT